MKHSYSQTDITENFGDNKNLEISQWIQTIPLNQSMPKDQTLESGLPSPDSSDEEKYNIAKILSSYRDSAHNQSDGVYCPVCHIANIDLAKLSSLCPKCGRNLLRFGWD